LRNGIQCKKSRNTLVNRSGFNILKMLSKKPMNIDQIYHKLEKKIPKHSIEEFLEELINKNILIKNQSKAEIAKHKIIVVDGIEILPQKIKYKPIWVLPILAEIFITFRCNMRCVHCIENAGARTSEELPKSTWFKVFDLLEENGITHVKINGGEPLVRKDIWDILEYLSKKIYKVYLLTNGILINRKYAQKIKEWDIMVALSLDGATPTEHAFIRGKESYFHAVINTMKLFKELGVRYTVTCIIHKKNYKSLEKIYDICNNYNAEKIFFTVLELGGRAKINYKDISPQKDELIDILKNIKSIKEDKTKISINALYPLLMKISNENTSVNNKVNNKKKYLDEEIRCKAGNEIIVISSNGETYPCSVFIGNNNFMLGNILNKTLQEIWFSEKLNIFRGAIKINDLNECKNCRYFIHCSDKYCRGKPYVHKNDWLAKPPLCDIYLE